MSYDEDFKTECLHPVPFGEKCQICEDESAKYKAIAEDLMQQRTPKTAAGSDDEFWERWKQITATT